MPLSMGLSTEILDPRVKDKSFESCKSNFGGTKKEEATRKVEVSPSDAV